MVCFALEASTASSSASARIDSVVDVAFVDIESVPTVVGIFVGAYLVVLAMVVVVVGTGVVVVVVAAAVVVEIVVVGASVVVKVVVVVEVVVVDLLFFCLIGSSGMILDLAESLALLLAFLSSSIVF